MQLLRGVWGDLHITISLVLLVECSSLGAFGVNVSLVLLVECSSLGAFGVNYTSQCIPSTTSRMQLLRGVWGELHITMYP